MPVTRHPPRSAHNHIRSTSFRNVFIRSSLRGMAWYWKYPPATDLSHFTLSLVRACIRLRNCGRISFSFAAMRLPIVLRSTLESPSGVRAIQSGASSPNSAPARTSPAVPAGPRETALLLPDAETPALRRPHTAPRSHRRAPPSSAMPLPRDRARNAGRDWQAAAILLPLRSPFLCPEPLPSPVRAHEQGLALRGVDRDWAARGGIHSASRGRCRSWVGRATAAPDVPIAQCL
jgi:hypothetical protein